MQNFILKRRRLCIQGSVTNKKIYFFQLNWDASKRFSKQSSAVGLTVFVSIKIKYNSLLVSLRRLQI